MQGLSTLGLKTLGIKPKEPKKETQPHKTLVNEGFFEQMKGIGEGVVDSVQQDLVKAAPDIIAQQVAGVEAHSTASHGDMQAGQEIDLAHGGDHGKSEGHGESHGGGHHATTEIGHHYQESIVNAGEHVERHEAAERTHEIHAMLGEIAQTAHGNEELQTVVANAEQQEIKGTVQELSWVERVLAGEKMKIDVGDSGSWMSALGKKNGKGKDYWSQASSKGTSFTQSNERSVATQVG